MFGQYEVVCDFFASNYSQLLALKLFEVWAILCSKAQNLARQGYKNFFILRTYSEGLLMLGGQVFVNRWSLVNFVNTIVTENGFCLSAERSLPNNKFELNRNCLKNFSLAANLYFLSRNK